MGWWSTDILGGDAPLDYEDAIYDICGIDKFPEEGGLAHIPAAILEENLDEIISMIDADTYDNQIGYQVLAVMMMRSGAMISPDIRFEIIRSCNEDEWAKEDEERQRSIIGLLGALDAYDNKTPIIVKSKGLFEVMFKKLDI
jgi:hypothetical protein